MPAPSNISPPRRETFWIALILTVALGSSLRGQDPAPAPPPAKPKNAYVRFWNMVLPPPGAPVGTGELQLLSSENHPVTSALPANFYAAYQTVPPATYDFLVRVRGEQNKTLKHLPVLLRAGTYITILVSTRDGQPVVELIDDTIDPAKIADLPGRLIVRQFMDGAQVKVSANRNVATDMLTYGQTFVLDNLPPRVTQLAMQATIAGVVRPWSTEVDFSTGRHATLLVVADPYGRFRPRIAIDGQTSVNAPDAGQSPDSSPRSVPSTGPPPRPTPPR